MTVVQLHPNAAPAGLALPPGRWHGKIWATDDPLDEPNVYRECLTEFERSGLWPVLIPRDERFVFNGEDWLDRGGNPPEGDKVGTLDPAAVLANWWPSPCCDGTCLDPFGADFPGLTRKSTARKDPIAEAGNFGWMRAAARYCRLGLVHTERAADIPAVLGWTGMINTTSDIAAISAVLRSWEDRFGARLVTLGFDALELAVAAPPTSERRALRVAAEHIAFCRENFTAQPGDLRAFSKTLVNTPRWRFWWD